MYTLTEYVTYKILLHALEEGRTIVPSDVVIGFLSGRLREIGHELAESRDTARREFELVADRLEGALGSTCIRRVRASIVVEPDCVEEAVAYLRWRLNHIARRGPTTGYMVKMMEPLLEEYLRAGSGGGNRVCLLIASGEESIPEEHVIIEPEKLYEALKSRGPRWSIEFLGRKPGYPGSEVCGDSDVILALRAG